MNYANSHEVEGHSLSEYVQVTTYALPSQYVIGTAANAALLGSWPLEGSLPQEAHKFTFNATEATYVYFLPLWMIGRQALPMGTPGLLPPGLPVPQLIPKATRVTFTVKACIILYAQVTNSGTLDIWIEG